MKNNLNLSNYKLDYSFNPISKVKEVVIKEKDSDKIVGMLYQEARTWRMHGSELDKYSLLDAVEAAVEDYLRVKDQVESTTKLMEVAGKN